MGATLAETFDKLKISQAAMTYSRPKILKHLISKAKLYQAKGKDVSIYYSRGLNSRYTILILGKSRPASPVLMHLYLLV